jgi:lysophospholipase L1-like esterase
MSHATKRLLLISGVIVLAPALVVLDIGAALARGWVFESRADSVALGAALVMLPITSIALAAPIGRRFITRRGAQLALLSCSLAFAWLLAELLLATSLASRVAQPQHLCWPGFQMTFHPDPAAMPGVSGESHFQANSRGIRGSEWPARAEAYRVLCLGGSTTECAYLDQTEAWPQLLAARLNRSGGEPVWVGNAGIVGYTSEQHLKFVEQSPLMEEIDALVMMVGINDLLKFLESEQLESDRAAEEAELERSRPLWSRSSIREIARRWVNVYAVQFATHYEDIEGRNHIARRQERQAATRLGELPSLDRALDEYGARLRRIAELCRAKGVEPIFVTQPILWDAQLSPEAASLLWLGWSKDGGFYDQLALRQGLDRFNARLEQAAAESDAVVIDLAEMNGRPEYFYDDCHFNEAGARFVAEQVADWFDTFHRHEQPRRISQQDRPAHES